MEARRPFAAAIARFAAFSSTLSPPNSARSSIWMIWRASVLRSCVNPASCATKAP